MLAPSFFAEFRRNLWLEFSVQRLLLLTVLCGLGLAIFVNQETNAEYAVSFTVNAVLFIGLFWGVSKIIDSIIGEFNANTWDFQRMSALSAPSLMFGKLLGAKSFVILSIAAIYLCGLLVLLSTGKAYAPIEEFVRSYERDRYPAGMSMIGLLFYEGAVAAGCILLASCVSFISAVQIGRGMAQQKRFGDTFLKATGITVGGIIYFTIVHTSSTVTWYGFELEMRDFGCGLLVFSLFWGLIGGVQALKAELQYKTLPVAWFVFILSCAAIIWGFTPEKLMSTSQVLAFSMITGIALMVGMSYLVIMFEDLSIVRYRKFQAALKAQNTVESLILLPRWVVTMVLALLFYCGLWMICAMHRIEDYYLVFVVSSTLCFAVRDFMLLHILTLRQPDRAVHITYVIYLAIFYLVLPYFVVVAMDNEQAAYFFYPDINDRNADITHILPALVQAGAMGWLLWRTLRSKSQVLDRGKAAAD